MKLTCPACETSYQVPDSAIGDDGRKVRCKECKQQWFQEGASFAAALAEADDFDIEPIAIDKTGAAPLPAMSQPASGKSWMIASIAMFILVFGAFLLQARSSLYSVMPSLYQAVGYYPNNGVVLANVEIEKLDSRRKKRFKITCALLNTSDTPQIHPPIAMRIISAGGNILAEDNAYVEGSDRMIEAGKHVDCGDLEIVHKFASADKVMLEIASPFEMGLRSDWAPAE